MRIKTPRLEIIPYSRPLLELAIQNPVDAATEVGAIYGTIPYELEVIKQNLYAMKLRIIDKNPKAWLFATVWQIISRRSRLVVGEIGFKGIHPNYEVELGYTTRYDNRCRGIMTEAVSELCRFAFEQRDFPIRIVSALTRNGNLASEAVLRKNGFIRQGIRFGRNYWIISREQFIK